ncbi:MAG: hypothetical protein AAEI08_05565 [Gammaproteobacteria bacterium]
MNDIRNYLKSDRFSDREKIALRYTDAILWNPSLADDTLWNDLHAEFSEPELVEFGYWVGFTSGGQRWLHTLHTRQGELAAYMNEKEKIKNKKSA